MFTTKREHVIQKCNEKQKGENKCIEKRIEKYVQLKILKKTNSYCLHVTQKHRNAAQKMCLKSRVFVFIY